MGSPGRLICRLLVIGLMLLDTVSSIGHLQRNKVHIMEDEQSAPVRTYSLEDFFWTGSGDGPLPPVGRESRVSTTTLLATVFLDSMPAAPTKPGGEDCVSECPIQPARGPIDPSRTGPGEGVPLPDPRYWLLTVLRAPAPPPPPPDLQRSLQRLYQRAFIRQQERHLGIVPTSSSSLRKKHHTDIKQFTKNHTQKNIANLSDSSVVDTPSSTEPSDFTETEVEFINDNFASSSTPGDIDDFPFEYVTNYFNVTPNTVIKVKRSTDNLKETLGISGLNNGSMELSNSSSDVVKRDTYGDEKQPSVEVFLHNVTREDAEELRVVYWVSVGGRPVPAKTAARDMKLLADAEVVAELGYPVTTKAEPYLKIPEALNGATRATNMRDTWLIVGGAILAAILLLSLLALLACRVTGRRKGAVPSGVLRDRASMARTGDFKDNVAYVKDEKDGKKLISMISPSKTQGGEDRYVSPARHYARGPPYLMRANSADSTQSSSSSDLSQMNATLRQRQRLFEKQMQSEYATVNKKNKSRNRRIRSKKVGISDLPSVRQELVLDDEGVLQQFCQPRPSPSLSSCSDEALAPGPRLVSPTSYLSMPSVKSFPRSNAVEPLSRVLEPLSVRHLDMDSPGQSPRRDDGDEGDGVSGGPLPLRKGGPVRLGSMGRDPGVISPRVWDMHRRRMHDNPSDPQNLEADHGGGANISRMRQRFSELVDDAFSLFGSNNTSPRSRSSVPQQPVTTDKLVTASNAANRRHSAKDSDQMHHLDADRQMGRPQTALPPRPPLPRELLGPTTAWDSAGRQGRGSSPELSRRPMVDTMMVNTDSTLPPTDPAVPLLRAIRKELDKLPGTSDA